MSTYHETGLSSEAQNIHRAITSLVEELQAVDWYNQRVDVSDNEELKAVLAHNRDEEVEHASMLLEWLRRRMPQFDQQLRTYLFTAKPITEIETGAGTEAGEAGEPSVDGSRDLGIGKL